MDWSFLDKVVYINLAKRTDRRQHMEEFIEPFREKVIRFEAIEHSNGMIGCVESHIEVLKMAIENRWKNVLILEDDAMWNPTDRGYESLKFLLQNPYDVILFGGSSADVDLQTLKLNHSQSTASYLINGHYFETLLTNFISGRQLLELNPDLLHMYSLDVYWNILVRKDLWYMILPNLIFQRPSISDIQKAYCDYTDAFITNISKIKNTFISCSWGTDIHYMPVTEMIDSFIKNKILKLVYTLFPNDPSPGNYKYLKVLYPDGSIQTIKENALFEVID
jgi:glycosyl transferase family 25